MRVCFDKNDITRALELLLKEEGIEREYDPKKIVVVAHDVDPGPQSSRDFTLEYRFLE